MSIVQVKSASKIYGEGELRVAALDNVSLELEEACFATLSGPSGSGKNNAT